MDPWSNTTTDTGNYPYLSLSCHRSEVSVLLGSPLPVPGIKLNNNTRKKRKKVTRWFEKKKNIYSRTRDIPIFSFFGLGSMSPPSFWLRILGVFSPPVGYIQHFFVERHIFVIDRITTITILLIIIAYIIIESCCSLFNYLLRRWVVIL